MHHALPVREVERQRRLACETDGVGDRELPLAGQPVAQGLAFDVRHGEPEMPGGLARVEYGQDVRVLEAGGQLDLAQEPFGSERCGELRVEHLERYRPVVLQVLRQVDSRHAAAAELALERVPLAQRRLERGPDVGH